MAGCTGCTREQARQLLFEAGMQPPLLAKPLWADGRDGAHGLAVIHEVWQVFSFVITVLLFLMPSPLRPEDVTVCVWHTAQVEGVEQLVSGEGPRGFGLPAMLQQYVEHGGCLFKVKPRALPYNL